MFQNRLRPSEPPVRLPRPSEPVVSPRHFVLYPESSFPLGPPAGERWRQDLYRLAFEQARAAVRPSLLERDLLGVWN